MRTSSRLRPLYLGVVAGLLAAMLASTAAFASPPHEGNSGGNCDAPSETGAKVDFSGVAGEAYEEIVSVADTNGDSYDVRVVIQGTNVQFYDAETGYPITVEFCVKASNSNSGTETGTEYDVDFENSGGQFPAISNVVVYLILERIPPEGYLGEWCSPGYWRQTHHLGSWEATGIAPSETYGSYFGAISLSPKAVRDGAKTDPTLWEVLQSPQWYGGEAFNNVGDLLSEVHPDVDFLGERVEDSCPLGRNPGTT
ncbi:hypothetical protein [Egicoccus sp. AB-alg2]|uniref:hypothetical protein n=1 Tax=Egicoccus sp. AB-alg2 TaxID=3242693 RepID=UPI00359E9D40